MRALRKSKNKIEFGDFQTPIKLARDVCQLLARLPIRAASIVEPTCGQGSFLIAALDQFTQVEKAIGLDINPNHVKAAALALQGRSHASDVQVIRGCFFKIDWVRLLIESCFSKGTNGGLPMSAV